VLKQWAQDYWTSVHPFNPPGAYVSFMVDDEGEAQVKAAYVGNYDRLARLKKKYDPANLFHVNQNIRPAAKHKGKSNGQGDYNDVMVAHDEHIGQMLAKLDELGIADDTIVMYSTDNGPHYNSWPDAGITPFRSEKNTNWEGGWRVPAFVRWPKKFRAGTVLNGIVSHLDWLPTLLAAAGAPDVPAKLIEGYTIGGKTCKVHIDGINMLPYLTGEAKETRATTRLTYCRRQERSIRAASTR
jgi:arylsulfatase A-like enzyme